MEQSYDIHQQQRFKLWEVVEPSHLLLVLPSFSQRNILNMRNKINI